MSDSQPTPVPLARQYPKEYVAWKCMRSRCANPRNASWQYYGAKGVTVCDRWRASFANFLSDLGPAPSPEHTVERDKPDEGYHPGNCSWATPAEQQANTSKVRFLEFRGVRLPILDMARLFGVPDTTLRARLGVLGWTVEESLLTPVNHNMARRRRRRKAS